MSAVSARRLPRAGRPGLRRGLPGRAAPAALGLFIVLITAFVLRVALDTSKFTSVDELYFIEGGRALAADPLKWIFDNTVYFVRGPERLAQIVMAVANTVFGTTPNELRATHVMLTLAYFLSAVPAYALARGVGIGRWFAVAVAAIAVTGPWILYASTMLNVTVGVPLTIAFAWAAWRAAMRPSVWNDALVIGLAGLNTVARTGHAPFAVVALLAVAYAVWVRRAPGEPLRRYPITLAKTHPLLVGVSVAAALVVAVLGPATVVGPAYAPQGRFTLPLDAMWQYLGHWTAQLTVSTGYLPMIIGAPWLLRELVRPRSPETGTFAAVALGLFAVWVYLTANHGTQLEERYVAVLGALPVIAFGAAIVRREAWPLGTLIVGALVARAVVAKGISGLNGDDSFSFFIAPGRLFYDHVLINRATTILPFGDEHAGTVIMVGALAVAVAAAVLVTRRRGNAPVAGVLAAAFVVCAVSAVYCLGRYTPATQPERSIYGSAWIERATRGEPTVLWAYDTPDTVGGRRYLIQLASFFNANTCCGFWLADLPVLLGPNGEVPARRDDTNPTHLVRFTGYHPLVFASRTVKRSTYLGHLELRVERPDELPLRAAARIEGTDPDGRLDPGARATVTYLPAAREPGRCLDIEVLSGPDAKRPVPFRVTGGGRRIAGTVADGRPRVITVPVRDGRRATVTVPQTSRERLGLGESRIRPCAR